MKIQYYSITIDKCSTKRDTTKQELSNVLIVVKTRFYLYQHRQKVECFELKKPTLQYPNGRFHYHGLLHSWCYDFNNRLKYTSVKVQDYSIKINLLSRINDVARWCGYIGKGKIDNCDIVLKKVQTFKKDHNNKKLICVPCILDFLKDKD